MTLDSRTQPNVPKERVAGLLLGTALGDALGFPFEGLSTTRATRHFPIPPRFRLLGGTGIVSDDTEQTALVAEALLRAPNDVDRGVALFRRSMLGWFARLPFGIGWATLRACIRMLFCVRPSGVKSAGNGAAMRAGIVGAYYANDKALRRLYGERLAKVTHTDARAVDAALFVAELAAHAATSPSSINPALVAEAARDVIGDAELRTTLDRALRLARSNASLEDVAQSLGNSGFTPHTLGVCTYTFAKYGHDPISAIETAIKIGGDADTHAAIVGGWVGALHGESALPAALIARIHDGPFGPTHLRDIADALTSKEQKSPPWSTLHALTRNLALYPVVLFWAVARVFVAR